MCFFIFRGLDSAWASGAHISVFTLIGMSLRKVNAALIVRAYIQLHRAGLHNITTEMEGHAMAGGNVQNVVNALIAADRLAFLSI